MTRSLTRPQALLLGLVVLAGLGLGCWALFRMGERQRLWSETVELRAGFSSAEGIEKGTPVRVRGLEAGQVVAIDLPTENNPDGKVYLRLRIDRKFLPSLCADAKARIRNEGVLGGRVIDIERGTDREHRLSAGDEIAAVETPDPLTVLQDAVQELRNSNGTVSRLMKSPEAHDEAVKTLQQMQETARKVDAAFSAMKQGADAVKKLPLLRGYVEDADALLYRPDCFRDRRIFSTVHLFEPGTSVLTEQGKQHLTNLEPWLHSYRITGSEVVIVSYCAATPSAQISPAIAPSLTQKQSETVLNYLKGQGSVHKVGWFTSRKVSALGMGLVPPPVPEAEPLSGDRTEIQIFIPR